jgi:hypothetical protein
MARTLKKPRNKEKETFKNPINKLKEFQVKKDAVVKTTAFKNGEDGGGDAATD